MNQAVHLNSEQRLVLKLLMRKRGLTSLDAAKEHDIASLHPRLTELEKVGVCIARNPIGDTRAKRYFATFVPDAVLEALKPKKREVCHA